MKMVKSGKKTLNLEWSAMNPKRCWKDGLTMKMAKSKKMTLSVYKQYATSLKMS